MAIKRKAISKRVRFEVLKRDAFTCQYCGKMPPDTVLHIDHIKPVSKGGNNGIMNLVTSCVDCNLGKSNIELSDDSAVKKQQTQLAEMAEKKAQIEMMVEWRESLINAEELLVDSAENLIDRYLSDQDKVVSDAGKIVIRKAVKKHGYQKVMDAVERAYVSKSDFSGNWAKAIEFAGSTTKCNIHYIKGVLKNNVYNLNERKFYAETKNIELTKENYNFMFDAAKESSSLNSFLNAIEEIL